MIQRYTMVPNLDAWLSANSRGRVVLYKDHAALIAAKDAEMAKNKQADDALAAALAADGNGFRVGGDPMEQAASAWLKARGYP